MNKRFFILLISSIIVLLAFVSPITSVPGLFEKTRITIFSGGISNIGILIAFVLGGFLIFYAIRILACPDKKVNKLGLVLSLLLFIAWMVIIVIIGFSNAQSSIVGSLLKESWSPSLGFGYLLLFLLAFVDLILTLTLKVNRTVKNNEQ